MAQTVIADLRERVTIQTATVTRGTDFNEEVLTWPSDGSGTTVWAKVTPRASREPMLADRPVMVVGWQITIRGGLTVTNKQRVLWSGKTFGIDTVIPSPATGEIVLQCTEVSV